MIRIQPSTSDTQILQVAIPTPVRHLFDYSAPQNNTFDIKPGMRVLVPFGSRKLMGIIIAVTNQTSIEITNLKAAHDILDQEPLFSKQLLELFIWGSKYYQYPIGMLLASAIPSWIRKQKSLDLAPVRILAQESIPALQLNSAQKIAVTTISESFGEFKAFLLDGVTGSGKTEVYMQLITQAIEKNLQTLILVPEINLTPQTLENFHKRFQVPIAILHSQISEKKRAESWISSQNGHAKIILGTRLATFTATKNLGLIIIDEEHDLSFKQQDHFRYSARDLLLKRAQLEQCPIVLGSATPSLESWHNAHCNKYVHLVLPQRAGNAVNPDIDIIDVRHKKLNAGMTNDLLQQIKDQLEKNNQVLIFLNRRGYAPVLMCYGCGWHQTCKRCDSNMILHQHLVQLRCHHCNAQIPIPKVCPTCTSTELSTVGLGTQRIEEFLSSYFPNARIARVDSDTIHTKKQLQAMLDAIHNDQVNILIGTQMLAKGHHFPNLALVAIIDIDAALYSADFRATERIAQLITQVAGRAGRANKIGKVVLQTLHPDNPMLQTLIYDGYHNALEQLISERELTNLPPYSFQIMFRAECKQPKMALQFLQDIKVLTINKAIQSLGPISAPMEKRQGFYRAQLLLQASTRSILQQSLKQLLPAIENTKLARRVRWSIDVDPVEMF